MNLSKVIFVISIILLSQKSFADCQWPSIGKEVTDDLTSVSKLFPSCIPVIQKEMGDLSIDQMKAIFSSNAAYSSKPYGGSTALALDKILKEEVLDCDNYAAFTSYIYDALGGKSPLRIVGFNGGAIGNHAQVMVETKDGEVLLDPTVGIVALIGFNDLLQGKTARVHDFRWRDEVSWLHDKVTKSITTGLYKPSDLMYWFSSLEEYQANPISSNWATPGASLIK